VFDEGKNMQKSLGGSKFMNMRILPIILIAAFLMGSVAWAGESKVESRQSNWTKIKEIFK